MFVALFALVACFEFDAHPIWFVVGFLCLLLDSK